MFKISYFAAIAVAMLLMVQTAKAQNPADYYDEVPRTFYGGLIAGANLAQVDGDNYAGYHKIGVNVGGIVYTQLGTHLAVSLEILFSQKGSKSNFAKASTNQMFEIEKYGINLNYAEVPIQINYFDKRKSHFGAGFSLSRLVSVSETATTSNNDPIDFNSYPFRKMDYNFIAGANLHLVKGLFLNLRFQYSLASIRNAENIPVEYGATRGVQYNNMWTLRLMYLFN